ncbi:MAG: HAD hydrolase family protein [Burkholderiales bacterium]|nr:HAD hydrolase family protein [Burkholderiales bacterium]
MDSEAFGRARAVRLLTCDVDGVLTDGTIYLDDHGGEMKAFNALDGYAMRLLREAGIAVAWITGSAAPCVALRAKRLEVEHVLLDISDKLAAFETVRAKLAIPATACAHIGDDIPDVPVMRACGFAATVPQAPAAVREHAHYVTQRAGGHGAVRELAEFILAAQGHAAYGALLRSG